MVGAGGTGRRAGRAPRVRRGQGTPARRPVRGRDAAERERARQRLGLSRTPCARPSSSSRPRACSSSIRGAARSSCRLGLGGRRRARGAPAVEQHAARAGRGGGARRGAACRDRRAGGVAVASPASRFVQADRRFHRAIVAAAGNRILTRQYEALRDRHQRIAAATLARDPARRERFLAEHRAIAAALERGDGDAAAALLGEHLRGAHQLVRRGR